MNENFYTILEIPETANADEIKKSYRRLSMLYHPDKNNNSNATEKFQKISEAYETLGDPDKKKHYDMTRTNPFLNLNSNIFFRTNEVNSHEQEQHLVDELFSTLFGFGSFSNPNAQNVRFFQGQGPTMFPHPPHMFPTNKQHKFLQKPTPIIKNVVIPIDKILTETTIPIDIERWVLHNENKVFENETIYVNIAKGIDDGEIIILRDKGNILSEECKGDVKLFIKIDNNTEFKRNGLDLIYEKTITLKEALCGFMFELKSISGKVYTINNNSGNIICHGHQKIVPNMGLSRDQHVGNLIIAFKVKFPEKISEETLSRLKQIEF
jgi:DnaJ-class molecular chaperone